MDVRVEARGGTAPSRIEQARRSARRAKLAVGALVALSFGVGYVGAKSHAPGHAKRRLRPLAAPTSFARAVRQAALSGGEIAPPQQPPPAVQSSVS